MPARMTLLIVITYDVDYFIIADYQFPGNLHLTHTLLSVSLLLIFKHTWKKLVFLSVLGCVFYVKVMTLCLCCVFYV